MENQVGRAESPGFFNRIHLGCKKFFLQPQTEALTVMIHYRYMLVYAEAKLTAKTLNFKRNIIIMNS